jgi:CheY-like chemotaxis protein
VFTILDGFTIQALGKFKRSCYDGDINDLLAAQISWPQSDWVSTMPYSKLADDNPIRTILIVDDDQMIVDLLACGFERYGVKVFKAENGDDAWNLFNRETIDTVITDIQMPGLNGKELSRRIRNQSSLTIIAVMTGGEIDVARELLQDGTVNYFFHKPFDLNHLFKSVIE